MLDDALTISYEAAMSLPGTRFFEVTLRSPLLQLPVRSVLFELTHARVLLSPASVLTADHHREAGTVTDLVAPSLMHAAGMKAAAAAHPGARLWGPGGIREKFPELKWHGILGVDPWPYEAELAAIPLNGMPKLNEVAFLHPASRALYLTDMVFNVREPRGWLAWMFFRMFGTYRRFAVSKLFLRMAQDRAALAGSAARIAKLDFDHVVPGHGDPLIGDAKTRLLAAFRERKLIA